MSNTDSIAQTPSEKKISLIYDQAIQSANYSPDSLPYYISLIQQTESQNPAKNFYDYTLQFLYAIKTSNPEEGKTHAFNSLTWASKTLNRGFISDAYANIALSYKDLNQHDSCAYFYNLALTEALETNDENRFHQISINYSNVLIKQGRKDEAMSYVMQSIAYDSLQNKNQNQGHNYHLLGNIYMYSGDYAEALEAYLIALAAYKKENNISKQINVMNNMGLVHTIISNYDQAKETYRNLIELIDAHGLQREKVSALINLGTAYLDSGDPATDRKLLLEALAITEKNNFVRFQAQIQNNLGNVAYYEGDYKTALECFQKALEINLITKNKQEETLCHSNIGWAYLMLNQKNECFAAFKKGLALATEIKSAEKRMLALEGLADASEYFGDFKDALFYKNKFVSLKDSLLGEKSRHKIAELEALYQTEKKQNEIENLKQEQELNSLTIRENELKISQLNWQRFGLALLIFLMIITLFFGLRLVKNKKEAEKNQALIAERERGLQAVFDATEEERQRIAKDLHDGIGQQMSGLKLAWQNLTISSNTLSEAEKQKLSDLSKILDSTSEEVRDISHRMMPKVLETFGLVPAIEDMLEKSFRLSDIKHQFEHFNFDERLPKKTEIAIFRICQELINNVIKHANASFVSIQLFKNQNQLILIVEDNGKGMRSEQKADGHGLLNIKSRLNTIHGQVNFEASENAGTTATIRIQLV